MNGGEVEFVFTGNTDQLKEKFKDTEKGLLGLTDIAEKAGESLDNMIDGDILKNLKSMGIEVGKTGAELKKALKDADNFVSGMESGLKIVVAEHAKLLAEINKMPEGNARNQLLEEYRNEAVEIEKVSNQITQYKEFLSNVKDESKSLSIKLKEVTDEMKVLYDRGEQNSVRYQELAQKASEYKESQDAVNKQVQIASGPQGFNGLINTLTFAAGGFSAVQGAIGLFGGESEDLNKIMLKVQSSLALVVGLQEIQKQVSAEGAFNITVLSRIKQIWAATNLRVATTLGISTGAAQALTATVTLGLSVAVIAIIALFQKWQTESDKTAEKNKQLTSSLSDSVAEPLFQYKRLQMQWNSLGEDLNKKKKFIDENKDSFNKLGVEVSNVSEAEKILGSQSDSFIEMMMLRAEAAANAQMAMESFKKSLELKGEANEKLKNPTIGQNISAWWQMGIMGKTTDEYIAGAYQESDAEKQKALDFTKSQVELMQKSNDLFKKMGLKKPTKENKPKSPKSPKSVADEFLPEGSVAEIQRRLSKIDEALSKATGTEQISQLKTNRIKTAIELAKAEKLIQIKTLQEQFDESEKLWQQYYSAVASLDKETADKIFGDALKNDKSSFEALEKQRKDLLAKGNLTDEEKNYFTFIDEKLNSMLGKKSQLDQFKQTIEETLSTLGTDAEKLNFINEKKTTANKTTGEYATLTEYENKILEAQKQRYQEFLAAHQSFEEKKNAITKNYAELRQKIEADSKLNNEQRKVALEKAGQEEADAYYDAFMTELVNNPQYREVFANLERQTTSKLLELRNQLQNDLSNNKNLNPEAQARIRKDIDDLNKLIGKKNPFILIKDAIKSFGNESLSAKDRLEILSDAIDATNEFLEVFENIINSVESTLSQLGVNTDNLFGDILNNVKNTISGIKESLQGVKDLKSSYNDFLEAKDNEDTFGKITAGLGMVGAGIKIVSGAIKSVSGWLSGDNKKERQIKAWANEVANLKTQYQELERAIDKALGDDKYKAQQTVIANLEKQKILLQQMIQKEDAKKKTDQGKINDWKQQISDLNAQIDDLKKSIVDDILQIDVKGLADKIGDALIEGFGRGEDALVSLNKTADEVFKDMVKNALNMELQKRMQPIIDEMLKAMGYSSSVNDDAIKAQIEALEKQKKELEKQINLLSPTFNPLELKENKSKIESINKLIAEQKSKLGQTTGSFDGLTPEEREALKAQIIAATGDYQKAMEQYADLFGPDAANSPNGLKGDIKGVTEKTAGALESQINAIRIYQVEALNISKRNQQIFLDSLRHQAEIASNTRSLLPMKTLLEDILTKLKKL